MAAFFDCLFSIHSHLHGDQDFRADGFAVRVLRSGEGPGLYGSGHVFRKSFEISTGQLLILHDFRSAVHLPIAIHVHLHGEVRTG